MRSVLVRLGLASALLFGGSSALPALHRVSAASCPAMDPELSTEVILRDSGLKEVSGIQSSLDNPGVLWAIEDSGNGPYLYAVSRTGSLLATYAVYGGARNVDWEAIAIRYHDGTDWIYVGDIGDNPGNRNGVDRPVPTLYRFAEPVISASQSPPLVANIKEVEAFKFRYFSASGSQLRPRDSEAMFADPRTGNVFIFLKGLRTVDGVAKVSKGFELKDQDLIQGSLNRAVHLVNIIGGGEGVGTGPVSADITANGEWIVVKNYVEGFLWRRPLNTTVTETLNASPGAPCEVAVDAAEAVGFGYSSKGVWVDVLSLRESRDGSPPLRALQRAWA